MANPLCRQMAPEHPPLSTIASDGLVYSYSPTYNLRICPLLLKIFHKYMQLSLKIIMGRSLISFSQRKQCRNYRKVLRHRFSTCHSELSTTRSAMQIWDSRRNGTYLYLENLHWLLCIPFKCLLLYIELVTNVIILCVLLGSHIGKLCSKTSIFLSHKHKVRVM